MSDSHLPVELENSSTREIFKDGDETPVTLRNKRKRADQTLTWDYKQKRGSKDLWGKLNLFRGNSISLGGNAVFV